ncbi:MAG: SAM-dependent chlorinase/fluorinase [Anaerolineales bacterium]
MSVLSLLTDFGIQDGFVGVMKGVIWGICPEVKIADISHQIQPQNIMQGAITLWRVAPFFPEGSVHVAVVDPGVGTNRRALAAQLGDQYYVAPDNGLLTPLIQDAKSQGLIHNFVELTNPKFWLSDISNTFHGRDIFAPVGAYLASGIKFEDLGNQIDDPILIELPQPIKIQAGWQAHVVAIDIFGNIQTDLLAEQVEDFKEVVIRLKEREIVGLVGSFGYREPGELIAVVDSKGFIEVAVVNGNAADALGVSTGDVIEVLSKSMI